LGALINGFAQVEELATNVDVFEVWIIFASPQGAGTPDPNITVEIANAVNTDIV